MKVTCQSCQAKYTIADEKVRGKVAKIRCKKCGTTIIVNGTERCRRAGPSEHPVADYTQQGAETTNNGRSSLPTAISERSSRPS